MKANNKGTELVRFTTEAEELKGAALSEASLIRAVENPTAQTLAVSAQRAVRQVLDLAEKARVEFKAPHLSRCREIDSLHKEWTAGLRAESLRLGAALGTYQTFAERQLAHTINSHKAQLTALERERESLMGQARTDDERGRIMEEYAQQVRDLGPMPETPRAEGQVVTSDWDLEVFDVHLLAAAHPGCVDIKPRLAEIKACLNSGATLAGVRATRVTKSTVRLEKEQKAIEA